MSDPHEDEPEDVCEDEPEDPADTAGDLRFHELAEEGRLDELDQRW